MVLSEIDANLSSSHFFFSPPTISKVVAMRVFLEGLWAFVAGTVARVDAT
jgi:hypothetical protein